MNKIFAAIIVLTFIVVHVAAEIPSYIHVCSRRDPNLDECIVKNVNNLKTKICEGIPELEVPSNNPLYIKKVNVINSNSIKLSINDVHVMGLCDFVVDYFHLNLEKLHLDLDATFERINLTQKYDFNVKVLVPIALNGPLDITTENISVKVGIDFKMMTRDGKQYLSIKDVSLNLDIKGYDSYFTSVEGKDGHQLKQIVESFLGNNQKEIIEMLKPVIEKIITKQILNIFKQILKHFTYDELFPDRT